MNKSHPIECGNCTWCIDRDGNPPERSCTVYRPKKKKTINDNSRVYPDNLLNRE